MDTEAPRPNGSILSLEEESADIRAIVEEILTNPPVPIFELISRIGYHGPDETPDAPEPLWEYAPAVNSLFEIGDWVQVPAWRCRMRVDRQGACLLGNIYRLVVANVDCCDLPDYYYGEFDEHFLLEICHRP